MQPAKPIPQKPAPIVPKLPAGLLPAIRSAPRPVVLIDGRSGSGKTTFALLLAHKLHAQLVRLDDLYPGWDGLEAASSMVAETVLAAEDPRWQRWDWASGEPDEWHQLDPHRPLVIEGCGALSRKNRALATFGIWIELDTTTRKRRAFERDGAAHESHWEGWAAHEAAFAEREHPQDLADFVLNGLLTAEV